MDAGGLLLACAMLIQLNWREPQHRLISPTYWIQRLQGNDLYDPRGVLWHGNRNRPEIALTFDDGPKPETLLVLDALKREGIQATFFMVGKHIKEYPEIARRVIEEGHAVGCHSYDHQRQTLLTEKQVWQQIWDSRILIGRVKGRFSAYRPPWTDWNEPVLNAAQAHRLPLAMYTYATDYQSHLTPEQWAKRVARMTHNGSILLLHDTYPTTADALPVLLRALKREGYQFVTIPEMIERLP